MSKTSNPQKRRKSSQNLPVFVPNIQAGAANLVDMVSGVAATNAISGVRYGIVNGVVTEFGVNQPALEDDGFRCCPAFTQLAKMSETLTDAIWIKPVEATGTSLIGTARIIYIGGSPVPGLLDQNIVVPGGTANKILTLVASVSSESYPQTFRLKNTHGAIVDNFSNDFVITQPSQIYFRIQNNNNEGNGYQVIGIAKSTDDQPFDINIGLNLSEANFIYPYSPNNTTSNVSFVSEAATAATGTSFDLDDTKLARLKDALIGPNAQGHLELIVKSNVDSAWWANNSVYNILSVNNTSESLIYINKDSGGAVTLRTTDGTNVASVTQGLTVGSTYKISIDWGIHPTGQKMRLTVNGVKSALANFSGSFGSQDLRVFYGNTIHAGWIKKDSFKIYDRPRW